MQGRRNSSALAMELRLSCTKPLICFVAVWGTRVLFQYKDFLFSSTGMPILRWDGQETISSLRWEFTDWYNSIYILKQPQNAHNIIPNSAGCIKAVDGIVPIQCQGICSSHTDFSLISISSCNMQLSLSLIFLLYIPWKYAKIQEWFNTMQTGSF